MLLQLVLFRVAGNYYLIQNNTLGHQKSERNEMEMRIIPPELLLFDR